MTQDSQFTRMFFIALVGGMAALAVATIMRVRRGEEARGSAVSPGLRVAGGMVLLYLIIPAFLASRGALDRYAPLPAPALVLVLALTLVTLWFASSAFGARLAASVSLGGLIGYQAFRVPVEWLLHRLFMEGVIPVQMTYAGRNFDIASGLTAAGLGLWLVAGRRVSRGWLLAWNLSGLGLLANIVVVAVLSTPVPFRVFQEEPANLLPSTFPYVWLPTFLVQAALLGHLLVFRRIGRPSAT